MILILQVYALDKLALDRQLIDREAHSFLRTLLRYTVDLEDDTAQAESADV